MKLEDCRKKITVKKKVISIRVTSDLKSWLDKRNYSPTRIFEEAVKELGYKGGKRNELYEK
jgi:hypothetical protein